MVQGQLAPLPKKGTIMSDDKKQSVWSKYTEEERAAVDELAHGYIDFLSDCKTERESVTEAVRLAQAPISSHRERR